MTDQNAMAILLQWIAANKERILKKGIINSLEESMDAELASGRIDFESNVSLARVTVWAEGFCDAEVINIENGKNVYYRHEDRISQESFADLMDELTKRLTQPSSE